jgi:hypothetical protein
VLHNTHTVDTQTAEVLMLRRSVLTLARRSLSTMTSQTPMEDAMRRKACPHQTLTAHSLTHTRSPTR